MKKMYLLISDELTFDGTDDNGVWVQIVNDGKLIDGTSLMVKLVNLGIDIETAFVNGFDTEGFDVWDGFNNNGNPTPSPLDVLHVLRTMNIVSCLFQVEPDAIAYDGTHFTVSMLEATPDDISFSKFNVVDDFANMVYKVSVQ